MKRICLTLSLLALLAVMSAPLSAVGLSYCDGVAGNLIANCGFETGDFTDWALAGADPVDSLVTLSRPMYPVESMEPNWAP